MRPCAVPECAGTDRSGARLPEECKPTMKTLACGLAFAIAAMCAAAATPEAQRIARVENGLLTANQVAGAPETGLRLADRMRFYNVPGVSIAMLDQGRIVWARAYGVADEAGKR